MGLTNSSIGVGAIDSGLIIHKRSPMDRVIALAGNPNVGKSTIFNGLTGMNQHTGNWPGKTVASAQGFCASALNSYVMVDLPGTYSLMAHSAEEEVARNFICFGGADAIVVVCDATCLERNMNLVLQVLEITPNVIVCINLMDEARRKHIRIDTQLIAKRLGVPVVGSAARHKKSLGGLLSALDSAVETRITRPPMRIEYAPIIEEAVSLIQPCLNELLPGRVDSRWLSLKLLDSDESLIKEVNALIGEDILENPRIAGAVEDARRLLTAGGYTENSLKDETVSTILREAERICSGAVSCAKEGYNALDRKIDRVLTGRISAYPVMLALLVLIFWITIVGANYPSQLLSRLFQRGEDLLTELFMLAGASEWLHGVLVLGMYRVLSWVVSVMLPPMAIFFPLFTLLEDSGYLPRIAYNLDSPFKRCRACGKQALTMCMGFGCNAAGVVGCRIIDSPRERLLAILTNNFVPCNGRFPMLITIISMFFIGTAAGAAESVLSALLLALIIVLSIAMTFAATGLLSSTLLKGASSSFTLELPPYRRPQVGKVIVRSIFDRTLFVLGRAAAVAAPAGIIIWLAANIHIADVSILSHCAAFLDPFAKLLGLDGVILIAFILGFPANEIVIPIIIMAYMAQGSLVDMSEISQMKQLFVDNGWTWITAVSVMLFSLMHWPCSTTLITIKKETGSLKWTAAAFLAPTLAGMIICFVFSNAARLLS